jgi:hypothetical protein
MNMGGTSLEWLGSLPLKSEENLQMKSRTTSEGSTESSTSTIWAKSRTTSEGSTESSTSTIWAPQQERPNEGEPASADVGEETGAMDEPSYLRQMVATFGPPPGLELDGDKIGSPPGLDKEPRPGLCKEPLKVEPYDPFFLLTPQLNQRVPFPLAAMVSPPSYMPPFSTFPLAIPWTSMGYKWLAAVPRQRPEKIERERHRTSSGFSTDSYDQQQEDHREKCRVTPLVLAQGLLALENENADCVIYLRGIHRLGFNSESILRQHYQRYGNVKKIFLSNAHEKPARSKSNRFTRVRIRPSSIALILMSKAEEVAEALAAGDIQWVQGVEINARKFIRKEMNGGSSKLDSDVSDHNESQVPVAVSSVPGSLNESNEDDMGSESTVGDPYGIESNSHGDACSEADLVSF